MLDKIWIVDESKLNEELKKALLEGKAVVHDGVAYWAKGSGKTGVIQHLPFKETSFKNIEDALKMAQTTTLFATAISTGIILAAIAIQTAYLSKKLDIIQATADLIAKDLHSHQIAFYTDKVSEYVGNLQLVQILLNNRKTNDTSYDFSEIYDIATPLLVATTTSRNKMMSFMDNIFGYASSSQENSGRNFELILRFVQSILELIPYGLQAECVLYARIGKLGLSEQIRLDGISSYEQSLLNYKTVLGELWEMRRRGKLESNDKKEPFEKIENSASEWLRSDINVNFLALKNVPQMEPLKQMSIDASQI